MAYEKHTWTCGEKITAEKLNNLEGGVEEALDKGYSCTEEITTLTEETVTTVADPEIEGATATLAYGELIDADTLTVTFDGQEYTCPVKIETNPFGTFYRYGASSIEETYSYDWSEYPFHISSENIPIGIRTIIYTETAGTYNVKIEGYGESVETTDCFKKAIQSVTGVLMVNVSGESPTLSKTYAEIEEAFLAGRAVVVRKGMSYYSVGNIGEDSSRGYFVEDLAGIKYYASSKNDYPASRVS